MKALSKLESNEVRRHLATAEAYLVDGARHSGLCHIIAAQRVMKGEPVPKGPDFWKLAGEANPID